MFQLRLAQLQCPPGGVNLHPRAERWPVACYPFRLVHTDEFGGTLTCPCRNIDEAINFADRLNFSIGGKSKIQKR
jgi:hypothetical protein